MALPIPSTLLTMILAQQALHNPELLASHLAASGAVPPPVPGAPQNVDVLSHSGAIPMPAPATPAPVTPGPNLAGAAASLAPAFAALAAPTTAGGGGAGMRYPPQVNQPTPLAPQTVQILQQLLAGAAPPPAASLGSLIRGG